MIHWSSSRGVTNIPHAGIDPDHIKIWSSRWSASCWSTKLWTCSILNSSTEGCLDINVSKMDIKHSCKSQFSLFWTLRMLQTLRWNQVLLLLSSFELRDEIYLDQSHLWGFIRVWTSSCDNNCDLPYLVLDQRIIFILNWHFPLLCINCYHKGLLVRIALTFDLLLKEQH